MSDTNNIDIPEPNSPELLPIPEETLELTAPEEQKLLSSHVEWSDEIDVNQNSNVEWGHEDVSVEIPEVTPQNEAILLDDTHLFDDVPDNTVPNMHETVSSMDTSSHEEMTSPIVPSSTQDTIIKTADSTISTVSTDSPGSLHQSGNVKIIFGVVFAWVVLVIAGAIWYFVSHKEIQNTPVPVPVVVSAETAVTNYEAEKEKVLATQKADMELQNIALEKSDASLCEKLNDESKKPECLEWVRAHQIVLSGSYSDCDTLTIPGYKDRCQTALAQSGAINSLDKTFCEKLIESNQVQACKENVDEKVLASITDPTTLTEEKCMTLEKKYQSACLDRIQKVDDNSILLSAISTDSLEKCQNLSIETLQATCFDTILLKRAIKSGDTSSCDLIRDDAKKATCMSQTQKKDDNETFRTAITEKNLQMCTSISQSILADRCNDSVILLLVRDTHDQKLCDTLKNTASLDTCRKLAGAQ